MKLYGTMESTWQIKLLMGSYPKCINLVLDCKER